MDTNDQDSSLESLLRGLPLREPTLGLDARNNSEFARLRSQKLRRLRLHRIAIAAGILIAIGLGIRLSLTKKAPPIASIAAPVANPIQIERDTSTVYDDGVVATTDDSAYQQFRRRTVREIWYVDPNTHAQLQVVIPTEQVLIQKVDAY